MKSSYTTKRIQTLSYHYSPEEKHCPRHDTPKFDNTAHKKWFDYQCYVRPILSRVPSSRRLDQRMCYLCFVRDLYLEPRKSHWYLAGFLWQTLSFLVFIPTGTASHTLEEGAPRFSQFQWRSTHLSPSIVLVKSSIINHCELKPCLSSVNLSSNTFQFKSLLLDWRGGSVVHLIMYCGQDTSSLHLGKQNNIFSFLAKAISNFCRSPYSSCGRETCWLVAFFPTDFLITINRTGWSAPTAVTLGQEQRH